MYLSCSSENEFFIGCVRRAITDFNERHQWQAFELVYPPGRIGGDLGKVLLNVELGLVVGEENRRTPTGEFSPWGGKRPLPRVHLFYSPPFQRRDLTPILNEYTINPYSLDADGEASLLSHLEGILTEKIQQAFGGVPETSQDAGAFQRSGASPQASSNP